MAFLFIDLTLSLVGLRIKASWFCSNRPPWKKSPKYDFMTLTGSKGDFRSRLNRLHINRTCIITQLKYIQKRQIFKTSTMAGDLCVSKTECLKKIIFIKKNCHKPLSINCTCFFLFCINHFNFYRFDKNIRKKSKSWCKPIRKQWAEVRTHPLPKYVPPQMWGCDPFANRTMNGQVP